MKEVIRTHREVSDGVGGVDDDLKRLKGPEFSEEWKASEADVNSYCIQKENYEP